jgi:hypothetical protein
MNANMVQKGLEIRRSYTLIEERKVGLFASLVEGWSRCFRSRKTSYRVIEVRISFMFSKGS